MTETEIDAERTAGSRERSLGATSTRFRNLIRTTLDAIGKSPVAATRGTDLKRDALVSVLRGRAPSIDRADEICRALGLEIHLGIRPQRIQPNEASAHPRGAEERQRDLEIRTLAITPGENTLRGYWSGETQRAPDRFDDPVGFCVRAADDRLAPAGLRKNDLALIAESYEPRTGDLAWLIDGTTGEDVLGLVVRTTLEGYDIVYWLGDSKKQELIPTVRTHRRAERGRIVMTRPADDDR